MCVPGRGAKMDEILIREYMNEQKENLCKFLKERYPQSSFQEQSLPDSMPNCPTVTMFKDQVIKFRNSYVALLEFASIICDKKAETLGPLDLVMHLYNLEKK